MIFDQLDSLSAGMTLTVRYGDALVTMTVVGDVIEADDDTLTISVLGADARRARRTIARCSVHGVTAASLDADERRRVCELQRQHGCIERRAYEPPKGVLLS